MTRTRGQMDKFIIRKAAQGTVPGNIAASLKVPVGFVFGRMDALGIEHSGSEHGPKYRVDPMWDADPEERRIWIWERQRKGARAAEVGMTHPDLITTSIWDEPGNVETLRRMWAEGASCSVIAAALGEGVTRNMVMGKKMRLKLPSHGRNDRVSRGTTPAIIGKKGRSGNPGVTSVRSILHRAETRIEDTRRVSGSAWQPLPGTTPVALVDLDHGACKWPIGKESPYRFCNAPTDGPYCPHHADMSVGRGTESERAAHRARLA